MSMGKNSCLSFFLSWCNVFSEHRLIGIFGSSLMTIIFGLLCQHYLQIKYCHPLISGQRISKFNCLTHFITRAKLLFFTLEPSWVKIINLKWSYSAWKSVFVEILRISKSDFHLNGIIFDVIVTVLYFVPISGYKNHFIHIESCFGSILFSQR